MLIALVTGQRCQSIYLMDLDKMQKNADHYKFVIGDLVKQSAPELLLLAKQIHIKYPWM